MTDWLDDIAARAEGGGPCGCAGTGGPGTATIAASARVCDRVLVSIIRTQGSCPRDAGTRMLISPSDIAGTIGGGHLEYQAIAIARELLASAGHVFRIERFALGARLGQCCGGVAYLSFETLCGNPPDWIVQLADVRREGRQAVLVTPLCTSDSAMGDTTSRDKLVVTSTTVAGRWPNATLQLDAERAARVLLGTSHETRDEGSVEWQSSFLCERVDALSLRLAVFGAGHVGKALVGTLAALPCRIDWIDSREQEFPDTVPANVTLLHSDHPEDDVSDLPPGTCVVIMTHSHAIDQRICEAALKRDDLAWCGLIGSNTKRALFERRLRARGLGSRALDKLTCPIGVAGIGGKHPAEIAIAVAADILQNRSLWQRRSAPDRQVACS